MGLSTTSSSKKVEKDRASNIAISLPAQLPLVKYDNDAVSASSPHSKAGSTEVQFNESNLFSDIIVDENKEVKKEVKKEEEVEDLREKEKELNEKEVEEEVEEEDLSDKAVEARHEGVLKGMRDKWAFLQRMRMERKYALLGLPFIWDEGADLGPDIPFISQLITISFNFSYIKYFF